MAGAGDGAGSVPRIQRPYPTGIQTPGETLPTGLSNGPVPCPSGVRHDYACRRPAMSFLATPTPKNRPDTVGGVTETRDSHWNVRVGRRGVSRRGRRRDVGV